MKNILLFVFFALVALNCAFVHSLLKVSGEAELHVLNIGQGDALLLVTADEHHILMDGGPGNGVLMELASTIPYLWRDIDLLILSHPHADHMEGLVPVLERFDVKNVLLTLPEYNSEIYEAFLDVLSKEGARVIMAEAGTDLRLGDLFFDVLYPFEPISGQSFENVNNASPVIRVSMQSEAPDDELFSLLLTGDAEQEVEAELLEAYPQCLDEMNEPCPLRASILKAGHHGSRTSSSLEFLEVVQPELMLISAGVDNSYGHPHPETLQKAAALGIEVKRTNLEGRISINLEKL